MLTIFGHPFASIGMGEQLRSSVRALNAVRVPTEIVDIYRYDSRQDPEHRDLILASENDKSTMPIRLFHINGDEVEACLRAVEARGTKLSEGYNIIMPAWELGRYPEVWAKELARFDEAWAISHFVNDSLKAAGVNSVHIGQACEFDRLPLLPRRHFGVRESAFVVLNFFDSSSYRTRKNPEAVIEMFDTIVEQRPFDDLQLVLKVKGDKDAEDSVRAMLGRRSSRVRVISQTLSTFETLSLINASDCFVSLHRAEGFGRGSAEAMLLGRLALATGWSGNLDYMTADNSLLVDYNLIPVLPGQYPFGDGQVWADPDVSHAARLLIRALDDRDFANRMAHAGQQAALLQCGNRAVGLRMLAHLDRVEKSISVTV